MIEKIKEIFYIVAQKYFIEVYYLPPVPAGEIPVGQGHRYIYFSPHGKVDFVKDPNKATCFDFLLGYQLVRSLKKEFGTNGLEFSMVSVADAMLMSHILNGTDLPGGQIIES